MLSAKENFFETINGGKPDRFVKQYEPFEILYGDPINRFINGGARFRGMEPTVDKWGVTTVWPADQVAAMPDHSSGKIVLDDVSEWRDVVKVPDLDPAKDLPEWEGFLERVRAVNRDEKLVTAFMTKGIFEQTHALMGFENALADMLMDTESMIELCEAISDYKMKYIELYIEKVHPDAILFHDDWGSKNSLFMSPELWRRVFKPQYEKIVQYIKDNKILLVFHADSFLEPIVPEMAEMGIDIWQGVLPENDIPRLQKELNGSMTLMGGIGAGIVDRPDSTEEEIRRETRRACEEYKDGGYFIPCLTYGDNKSLYPGVNDIIDDEIDRCSREMF